MSSYLLYEPNNALCTFTATSKLQFYILDLRGKIIKNVNFLPISQNSDLSLQLNSTHQHESKGILGFQNRAPDIKLLKFHANRDNSAYLEKCNFQRKLVCKLWDCHWIHGVEMSQRVVSDLDFESRLTLHVKRNKL